MKHSRRIYWWSTSADNRWGGLFYGALFLLVSAIMLFMFLYLLLSAPSC